VLWGCQFAFRCGPPEEFIGKLLDLVERFLRRLTLGQAEEVRDASTQGFFGLSLAKIPTGGKTDPGPEFSARFSD
jgi:hypothetical protein